MLTEKRYAQVALALIAAWLIAAISFAGQLGIQADESLFTHPLFEPTHTPGRIKVGGLVWPTMIMTYLGTVKTNLVAPVFALAGYNVWTLRMPGILLTAATLFLTTWCVRRIAGPRAALLTLLFLVTDATFLLTSTFDWGPVVLQHAAFAGMCAGLIKYAADKRPRWLWLSGFACGLGFWDKALFIWIFAGAICGIAAVGRDWLRQRRPGEVLWAAFGFVTGAFPFLVYCWTSGLAPFRGNAKLDWTAVGGKAVLFWHSLDGTILRGFFTIGSHTHGHAWPFSGLSWIVLASVFALFFLPKSPARSAAVFALITSAIALALMFCNKNTGASAHHLVLVYPLPHLIAGCVIALLLDNRRAWIRGTAALVAGAVGIAGACVIYSHWADIRSKGLHPTWSDAQSRLAQIVREESPAAIYADDWGFIEPLSFRLAGKITIEHSTGKFWTLPKEQVVDAHFHTRLRRENVLRVRYANNFSMLPAAAELLDRAIQESHCQPSRDRIIRDRLGKPVYRIYYLQECAAANPAG